MMTTYKHQHKQDGTTTRTTCITPIKYSAQHLTHHLVPFFSFDIVFRKDTMSKNVRQKAQQS